MFTNEMIKKAVTVSMASVMMLSVFTACGSKVATEDEKETKPAVTTTIKADKDKKPSASKENTAEKVENKEDKNTDNKSESKATTKKAATSTTKKAGSGKKPVTTRPKATEPVTGRKPAPTQAVTQAPTTRPAPISKYGTWGSISQMEADCAAYAHSLGYHYGTDGTPFFSGEDGSKLSHYNWDLSVSNYNYTPEQWKARVYEIIKSNLRIKGDDIVRVFFLTKDNYRGLLGDDSETTSAWSDADFSEGPQEIIAVIGTTISDREIIYN